MVLPSLPQPRSTGIYADVTVTAQQRQIISKAQDNKLTLDQTRDALRAANMPMRRQAMSDVRTELARHKNIAPRVRSIRSDFKPTRNTISQTNMNIPTKYRIRGSANTRNRISGETFTQEIVFGSDELETMGSYRERGREIIREAQETSDLSPAEGSPSFDIVSTNITLIEERSF